VSLAALLALAAAPALYPAAAVMDAMRGACSDVRAVTAAAGPKGAIAGWTRVADPASTPVGGLVAFGQKAGEKMLAGKGQMLGDPAVFRREVAGEELYLVLSAIEMEGRTVRGCRLYDPGETRPITPAAAEAWVGRKATGKVDGPDFSRAAFEPGFAAGQDSFEVFFVPATSPVRALTKIGGVALKADWIGIAAMPGSGGEK